MISDYLYNTKLKIYPDQTIVATFANRPKFRRFQIIHIVLINLVKLLCLGGMK